MLATTFVFISWVWITYTKAEFTRLEVNDKWQLYFSRMSQDCSAEGKSRRFPELYEADSNVTEIGPPTNFSLAYFEKPIDPPGSPNFLYPGMAIDFYPPDIGLDNLKGYELEVKWKTFIACFVYVFNQQRSPMELAPSNVNSELFPVTGMMSYWFVVTSLPLHSSNQSSEPVQLVTSLEHYKDPTGKLPEPADWFAHISYDVITLTDHRSLQIIFSRPPPEYGFQRFQIALVPIEDYIHVRSAITTRFYHEFRAVERGHYKISIKAIDDFFSQYGRCLCHDFGKCTNCLSSETAVFAID